MKRFLNISLLAILAATVFACNSYRYYEAGTTKLSTSKYKTFAWIADPAQNAPRPDKGGKPYAGNAYYNNSLATQAVRQATFTNLQGKGLSVDENTPDLLVHYSSAVGKGQRLDYYPAYPYYWGGGFYRPFWGWGGGYGWGGYGWGGYGGWGGGYAYPRDYREGTIIIDLIDRKTNTIVWRGYGVGELRRNPGKTIEDLPKVVDGIFKQLPVAL